MTMQQKSIAYKSKDVSIEITESRNHDKLVYCLYAQDDNEFKMLFDGPEGNLLNNFSTLEDGVKQKLQSMLNEYNKTSFIRNKHSEKRSLKVDDLQKVYISYKKFPLNEEYNVTVQDVQNSDTLDVTRKYYVTKNGVPFEYLVEQISGDLADFVPAEENITSKKEEWIKAFDDEIVNCVLNELKDIKEYIDKSIFGDNEYGIIEYEDGSYCYYTLCEGEYSFEKTDSLAQCFGKMHSSIAQIINEQQEKTPIWLMRTAINNCRKNLSKENSALFMAEMGAMRGIMMVAGIEDAEAALPEETAIGKYFERFSQISKS